MRSVLDKANLREILLASGVLFCIGYAWLSTAEIAPNERARIYLSVSLVDRGELKVDEEVRRFGMNWDLSKRKGHYYCNKPPGASFLGAVPYQIARWVGGEGDWSIQGLFHVMRFGVMLPLALLGFLAIRRWMRLLDLSEVVIDVTSVGWMMGSAAFHYAGAFFSHHIVAVFLVTALWLLEAARQQLGGSGSGGVQKAGVKHAIFGALAGLSLGIVGLTEYQAGVSSLFVAIWALGHRELRQVRVFVPFAVAAALCVAVLLGYDIAAFGGPFEFSYEYHLSGGGGEPISYPQLNYLAGLLFSLHWGLFMTSPWFVLIVPGVYYLLTRRKHVGLVLLIGAILLFRLVLLSGYKWWTGGWGFGPRHLVATMGLLTVLSAFGLQRLRSSAVGRAFGAGLVLAGIAYNQVQVAFLGELPHGPENPIMDVVVPFVDKGVPSPNLLTAIWGVRGLESLIPLGIVAGALFVFVLFRGLSSTRGIGRRVAVVFMTLLVPAAFGLHIYARGTTWRKSARKRFQRMMERRFESDYKWHRRDNRRKSKSKGENSESGDGAKGAGGENGPGGGADAEATVDAGDAGDAGSDADAPDAADANSAEPNER